MLVIDEGAGDWVYDRLTDAEKAHLSEAMHQCCLDDFNEFYCDLGNAGLSTFLQKGDHPTEQDMREMCRQLTIVRFVNDQIQVDWDCLLRNAFGEGRERVRALYIKATGITDEAAFEMKERDPLAVAEAMASAMARDDHARNERLRQAFEALQKS